MSENPLIVLEGVMYNGQPVFKQWNAQRTACHFLSREVDVAKDGSWTHVRWVPLHEVKVDHRYGLGAQLRRVELGLLHVLTMRGVRSSVTP
jgi:hypothetical protein